MDGAGLGVWRFYSSESYFQIGVSLLDAFSQMGVVLLIAEHIVGVLVVEQGFKTIADSPGLPLDLHERADEDGILLLVREMDVVPKARNEWRNLGVSQESIRAVSCIQYVFLATMENLIAAVGEGGGTRPFESGDDGLSIEDEEVCARDLAHTVEEIETVRAHEHLGNGTDHQGILSIAHAFAKLFQHAEWVLIEGDTRILHEEGV